MQQPILQTEIRTSSAKLSLSMASTAEELREVQRLRYKVFIETMGLTALASEDGLDSDEFDEHCDHLIVRDTNTLRVVGTYRLLSAARAHKLGRVYSENEFDLSRLNNVRSRIVEAGRACIHPDYRGGSVIMLLWSGLAEYMRRGVHLAGGQAYGAGGIPRHPASAFPLQQAGSRAKPPGAAAAQGLYAFGRMDLRRTGLGS
jgi:putative hemolysin